MSLRRIRERAASLLDVPQEALGERLSVTTVGFFDTTVDGCAAIIDYSPSHVILECAGERVVIEGEGLRVGVFARSRVRICGRVTSISTGARR